MDKITPEKITTSKIAVDKNMPHRITTNKITMDKIISANPKQIIRKGTNYPPPKKNTIAVDKPGLPSGTREIY